MASPRREGNSQVRYLDTTTAYDLWSEVYDTDGNFLQALDSAEVEILLPKLVAAVDSPKPWTLVDLGCGTGRNTARLVQIPDSHIIALDLSPKMLDVARKRLDGADTTTHETSRVTLQVFDVLDAAAGASSPARSADAVVSTLVVEHVPLAAYFAAAAGMLKPGGLLLLTNMHSDMGRISQAGFVDPATGDKIRPQSYAHSVADVVAEAARHGLAVASAFEERCVTEDNYRLFGLRAKKWVGVRVWYGGILRKI
ncbi:cyclopropane-fatty-acyl-phospholipid synthase [Lasiosphaeria ovina]|uniref:Cyclopropane-fatty-acyl-phospholipid synthase n=1 Tax=Lasiosphaeria ovina TaxID=92902 RepID=A0AAE0KBS2_9PEZI|nr:cyclopropane-fatty-acyl-phospholipid synthase [Lasiosphaeria ovina]